MGSLMIDLDKVNCDDKEELSKAINSKVWFHSVDIGNGIITKGQKTHATILAEAKALEIPPLQKKTVLDIGAYDGFYSFEAERLGASRVVSLDTHAWEVDTLFAPEYIEYCKGRGEEPSPPYKTEWLRWQKDTKTLPGKKKFDLLRRALKSKVEPYVGDFILVEPEKIGTFDVVFFMGVLYHLEDPMRGMRKVASFTKEVAVIETAAVAIAGYEDRSLFEYYPADELNGDASNWWAPNLKALTGMCVAAGFKKVEIIQGPPADSAGKATGEITIYRAIVHAWK